MSFLALSALGVYQGFKLGTALATFAARMYGQDGDVVLDAKGLAARVRRKLSMKSGERLLESKALGAIEPWVKNELRAGRIDAGDVEAAGRAVLSTFNSYDGTNRAAVLAVINRRKLEEDLTETGAKFRASLGNEGAQRVFDQLLRSCIEVLKDLVPVAEQRGAEALKFLYDGTKDEIASLKEDTVRLDTELVDLLGVDIRKVVELVQETLQLLIDEISEPLRTIEKKVDWLHSDLAQGFDPYHLNNPPSDPQKLIETHSAPRMERYLRLTGNDPGEAMRLYQWNRSVSSQLYQAIYIFEIVLRNAMDIQLRRFNRGQVDSGSPDWTKDPAPLIYKLTTPKKSRENPKPTSRIADAIKRAERELERAHRRREPNHDDIVAQTSLRMWRNMLPSTGSGPSGRKALWRECLVDAFPLLEYPPARLGENVELVVRVRNRLAHMEPFLSLRRLWETDDALLAVLRAISPEATHWYRSTQNLTTLMEHDVAQQLTKAGPA